MNRIRELRREAGLSVDDIAQIVGVDFVCVALAELGIGLIDFTTGLHIAHALHAKPGEVFPDASATMEEIDNLQADDLREALLEKSRSTALRDAGIDPDLAPWYAIITLRSGNVCKYHVSSNEVKGIRSSLCSSARPDFIVFLADCRNVVVRTHAIAEVVFTNTTSYTPFSTEESAFEVLLITRARQRPERLDVIPDGGPDGLGSRDFSDFIDAVKAGDNSKIPAFVSVLTDDEEERIISMDLLETMEIPVGVTMPTIYYPDEIEGNPTSLHEMQTAGTA